MSDGRGGIVFWHVISLMCNESTGSSDVKCLWRLYIPSTTINHLPTSVYLESCIIAIMRLVVAFGEEAGSSLTLQKNVTTRNVKPLQSIIAEVDMPLDTH